VPVDFSFVVLNVIKNIMGENQTNEKEQQKM
jgi:hypothetical protein